LQGLYLYTEQHKHRINAHNTDIHALSGIRIHDPSIRASEDSSCSLRPEAATIYIPIKIKISFSINHRNVLRCSPMILKCFLYGISIFQTVQCNAFSVEYRYFSQYSVMFGISIFQTVECNVFFMEYRYFGQSSITRCFSFSQYTRYSREFFGLEIRLRWHCLCFLDACGATGRVSAGQQDDLDWAAVAHTTHSMY
jgi:hypothetical protein